MILPVRFAGADLLVTLSGALYWPAMRMLIVADLHLEKGSAFARRGVLLPPYDSRATITRLAAALAEFRPATVVCLGDSFHDADAGYRLASEDGNALGRLTAGCDWLWVAGNHDHQPSTKFGGRVVEEVQMPPLQFRHCAVPGLAGGEAGEISGHFHPKASIVVAGRRITARCFVGDATRLILPAFGAYTGGLDVLQPAIARLLQPSFSVMLLGRHRVHRVAGCSLTAPVAASDRTVPPPGAPQADLAPRPASGRCRR